MRGGKRENAGRKPGSSGVKKNEAKRPGNIESNKGHQPIFL